MDAKTSGIIAELIVSFVAGFIASWTIGLLPALIYRYGIYRRPIAREKVFWRLAPIVAVLGFAFKFTDSVLSGKQISGNPIPWVIIYYIGSWIMTREGKRSVAQAPPPIPSAANTTTRNGREARESPPPDVQPNQCHCSGGNSPPSRAGQHEDPKQRMHGCLRASLIALGLLVIGLPLGIYFGGKALLGYARESNIEKPLLYTTLIPEPQSAYDIASNCVTLTVPQGVSMQIPSDWRVLDSDTDAAIRSAAQKSLRLSYLPIPTGTHVCVFRANSRPPAPFASIAVNANELVLEGADLLAAGKIELRGLDTSLRSSIEASADASHEKLISYDPTRIVMIGAVPAILVNYTRSGPKGPVAVRMIRIPRETHEIAITLSYRMSEPDSAKHVVDYISRTIMVE